MLADPLSDRLDAVWPLLTDADRLAVVELAERLSVASSLWRTGMVSSWTVERGCRSGGGMLCGYAPPLARQGWLLSQPPSTDGRGAFQAPTHVSFWNSNSFWYYTRADQNRFIDCPVRFRSNRLKNFFPSKWHRNHQIVYVKADLLKVAGRVPGGVAI